MASPKIRVESPLGAGALLLHKLRGHEQLGRLFSYEVEVLASKPISKLTALLGEEVTVVLNLPDDAERFFHGYVTEIAAIGSVSRYHAYRLTMKPWLWFLTRTSNCRIFQRMTVPEIVAQVLRERGFTDVEDSLTETYPTCEYSVQYRESEFDFLSRLMEREGIYYFFRHEKGKHTLVLADGHSAHEPAKGYESVPYFSPQQGAGRERDHLSEWSMSQNLQTGAYVLNDFDYKRPKANLEVKVSSSRSHSRDDYENFDYPGGYLQTSDGESYARARLEEQQAQFEIYRGTGNARGLSPGALFKLARFPTAEQNQEYLVSEASYDLYAGDYESGGSAMEFSCAISAITGATHFRPTRETPKPVVHGPQTAIVVGKAGEEIWTDELGRVKVQFHWDREGVSDENSSCWVRVSQAMAGAKWGAMHVPRLGQEVVVSFLEGDPDQPLVTGRVYNGANKPPFDLPAKGMVSGIKTDSTPKGGGYNEFSMDDTKDKEAIILHAQKDMTSTVEHDQFLIVKNNRTATVDADDKEDIKKKQTITVGEDQSTTVSGNIALITKKKLTITADDDSALSTKKKLTIVADADASLTTKAKLNIAADSDIAIAGKTKGVFEITNELTIKVGAASIKLEASGAITIKGAALKVEGSTIALKGGSIKQN